MPTPIFSDYFGRLQEQLKKSADLAGLAPGSGEGGKNREILVASTLRAHLPRRAEVVQGALLADTYGLVSNQVDVLVCNDFSFRGGALTLGVFPVEAVIAAIEVKSTARHDSMSQLFHQNERIKRLKKRLFQTHYDEIADARIRTGNPLVVGWFWVAENYKSSDSAAEWLLDPKGKVRDLDRISRPNAIYMHGSYLVITDPSPHQGDATLGAGKPNPFLQQFRKEPRVLRDRQYNGTGGTMRDIYQFEDRTNKGEPTRWNSLEVLLMWLAHEVNRYTLEVPHAAMYVSVPSVSDSE